MSHHPLRWRLRGAAALLVLASLALHAAFPKPAWAACGPLDMGACVDNAEYSFYYLIASIAWNVNRWLLLLAYQFDQLRAWLVDVAFSGMYQWLTSFVEPVYVPIATAALMLAAILFMLVPLTGETGVVNLRHVIIWAVLTPVVLTVAGQLIGQAEQVRSDVSAQLFAQVSQATPGAIFGSPGSDMPAPVAIYPANPCGTTLARRTTTGIAMDALAAALMYADAGDIHCPDARGPSRDIPDGFYQAPPAYAYDGYVGDLDSAVERRGWVEGMQRGMNRLLQGIIPSFLAVLESLIHLVFSLSMAILWLSLPIGLIFVWFQQTASPVTAILRRAASILIVSWMASLLMGVLSAALVAAAELGNAGAYTGMAVGGLFLMGYLVIVALTSLWKSIGTVEHTALSVTGMSFTQPLQTAAQLTAAAATAGAAGLASGGAAYVGMAAMGSAAFAQARNASLGERVTYTASAMAGRLPGAGAVGEVAAAMGWLSTDSAMYEGLYAGDRSRRNWRSARLELERDATGWAAGATASPPRGPAQTGGAGPQGPQPPAAPQQPGGSGATGQNPGPARRTWQAGTAGVVGGAGQMGAPASAAYPATSGAPSVSHQAVASPSGSPRRAGQAGAPGATSVAGAPGVAGASGAPAASGFANTPSAPCTAGASGSSGTAGAPSTPSVTGVPGPTASGLASGPGALSPAGTSSSSGSVGTPGAPAAAGAPGAPSAPRQLASAPGVPSPAGAPGAAATSGQPGVARAAGQPGRDTRLPAEHPHVAHASAQIPPLPNTLHNGEDWQYTGSTAVADGYQHTFSHPRHPLTGRPEIRTITTRAGEVDAQPQPQGQEEAS